MIHASLFSGIGGFDLAAEWAGWDNAFNCEIDTLCRKVLKYHFPNAAQYEDIKTTDFTVWRGKIDVLTGGFPCQPFSTAGKREGTADNRYLWPEMLRAIREIRPKWVVGENVLGIISWNGGMVFEQVHADLEAEGFEVQSFVLPACGVGAPHQRYRTWIVAYNVAENPKCDGRKIGELIKEGTGVRQFWYAGAGSSDWIHIQERTSTNPDSERGYMSSGTSCKAESVRRRDNGEQEDGSKQAERDHGLHDVSRDDTHTKGERLQERNGKSSRFWPHATTERYYGLSRWENFPTQSPVRSRYDGISCNVVRYIKQDVYDAIKKYIRREDLPRVWEAFQEEEIRQKIGRLYEIPEPNILLEVLQRTSEERRYEQIEDDVSQFSERTSEKVLRYLRKYGTFASSPFGQKYKEQFSEQFGDSMPILSHEIALATKKIIEECESTASWVRSESIKAYGNAIVPQVAYRIFDTINKMEEYDTHRHRPRS